jgi:gliding motility-associated-like protein
MIGKDINLRFFIPNAFSPNGDELNDRFQPVTAVDLKDYTLTIYNRWGELIYQSQNQHKGWDGMHQGKPVPQGTYV